MNDDTPEMTFNLEDSELTFTDVHIGQLKLDDHCRVELLTVMVDRRDCLRDELENSDLDPQLRGILELKIRDLSRMLDALVLEDMSTATLKELE